METQYNHVNANTNQAYYQQQEVEPPVTVGEWLITFLILLIPLVNIIMIFVWAFGDGKKSKQNFFKAYLIYFLIALALGIILFVLMGAVIVGIFSELGTI